LEHWSFADRVWRAWDRFSWAIQKRGVTGVARKVWRKLRGEVLRRPSPWDGEDLDAQYQRWIARHERGGRSRPTADSVGVDTCISLLCPVGTHDIGPLSATIASVRAQRHRRWQLVVAHAGAAAPSEPTGDPRVERIAPCPDRASALSAALAAATGDAVAIVEPGAILAPRALEAIASSLALGPEIDLVYTDEDVLRGGQRVAPALKIGWSPDLVRSTDHVGGLCVVRTAVAREGGGIRPGFEGAEAYDLLLRCIHRIRHARHVPEVLYHRTPYRAPTAAQLRAAADHAASLGAAVEETAPGRFRVRYPVRGSPRVSVIVPTRDRVELLRTCVTSLLERTTYRNIELLVVDNESRDPATRAYLESLAAPCRVLSWRQQFNWSAINNAAAREASGDYLLFLNNDVELIAPGSIEAMLEHAQRAEVGAVGAKLLYPDRTVQHAGVVIGIGGFADHAFRHLPADAPGYGSLAAVVRDCSAVTGACLMTRRGPFEEVGGFDERLRVAFNDVDFCLRLRERGLLIVWTPHALLFHHESATRGAMHPRAEYLHMRRRWRSVIVRGDPYYNAGLTLDREDFSLDL
jgi:GT2 family glycosyltransferase